MKFGPNDSLFDIIYSVFFYKTTPDQFPTPIPHQESFTIQFHLKLFLNKPHNLQINKSKGQKKKNQFLLAVV